MQDDNHEYEEKKRTQKCVGGKRDQGTASKN